MARTELMRRQAEWLQLPFAEERNVAINETAAFVWKYSDPCRAERRYVNYTIPHYRPDGGETKRTGTATLNSGFSLQHVVSC